MKPAPPVIMMFFTSGRGSNLVVPVKTGASFQTPKSSKKFWRVPLTPVQWVRSRTSQGCVTIHVPFEIPLVPLM